ncbi:MAG: hypothetical protein CVU99_02210 [Firmicutes bacterium HGW-Firmicutes-4]|nr:MAG: hypothetical protein CVU99_02210 [Firmicutes bacterium HGW-Firmicutes-4]
MITVNNQQYEFLEHVTIAGLLQVIKNKNEISTSALLVIVNDVIICPAAIYQVFIKDGDIIKTRNLPVGG